MSDYLLKVRGLSKAFGHNYALRDVSLTVASGEIVALLGHNGSGKSTLVKVLSGVYQADSGEVSWGDSERPTSLHVVHQNLGLIGGLSIAENIDLTTSHRLGWIVPTRRSSERREVRGRLRQFGLDIDVDTPVGRLTAAQQSIVAIARAFHLGNSGRNVLVLDEPTAALHGEEAQLLHDAVKAAAAAGCGVIYISHRLPEVVHLADRAIVLKDGEVIAEKDRGSFDQSDLVRIIAGGEPPDHHANVTAASDDVRLRVSGLYAPSIRGAQFEVRRGEILGVGGLVGSGMEALNGVLFGATAAASGTIEVDGRLVGASPAQAVGAGVAFVPADRRLRGSIGQFSARENLTLTSYSGLLSRLGAIRISRERTEATNWMGRVRARPLGAAEQRFDLFSGGNQQKIVLAKWLRTSPGVLLLDEPTQGVDVGAQSEIYRLISEATDEGAAVVVCSSDSKELASLCDRVIVFRDGVISGQYSGARLTESALVAATIADGTAVLKEGVSS